MTLSVSQPATRTSTRLKAVRSAQDLGTVAMTGDADCIRAQSALADGAFRSQETARRVRWPSDFASRVWQCRFIPPARRWSDACRREEHSAVERKQLANVARRCQKTFRDEIPDYLAKHIEDLSLSATICSDQYPAFM